MKIRFIDVLFYVLAILLICVRIVGILRGELFSINTIILDAVLLIIFGGSLIIDIKLYIKNKKDTRRNHNG